MFIRKILKLFLCSELIFAFCMITVIKERGNCDFEDLIIWN